MVKENLKFVLQTKMLLLCITSIILNISMVTAAQVAYSQQQYSFVAKWGSRGTGNGQFLTPSGIAIDPSGDVYVGDVLNHRIQKFSSDGKFLTKWGSRGTGNGQFLGPSGIAIDSSGNVYIADRVDNNIQKFSSDGKFLTKWGSSCNLNLPNDPHCNSNSNGASEPGDGQFNEPQSIAIDSSSNVYVTDSMNGRIEKFNNNGTFVTKWNNDAGGGNISEARGISMDSSGKMYVSTGSDTINVFTNNGTFLTKWGSTCIIETGFGCRALLSLSTGQVGDAQFNVPTGLAFNSNKLYVVDTSNNRIQVFTNNGTFVAKWGSKGTAAGQFDNPIGVAVNGISNHVYVSDGNNDRIEIFAKPNNIAAMK